MRRGKVDKMEATSSTNTTLDTETLKTLALLNNIDHKALGPSLTPTELENLRKFQKEYEEKGMLKFGGKKLKSKLL